MGKSMSIRNKQIKMIKFRDFYDGDLISLDDIPKARTNEDLRKCLQRHYRFLEDQQTDALAHLDRFIKELKLY